ncbi:hypothetical protein TNCV_3016511 [Trichonephila clavipes]|nr:hypothetical protein TNCV_3016511 [Trichonephila clavipes]
MREPTKKPSSSQVISTRNPLDPQKSKEHHLHTHRPICCRDPKDQEPWKAIGNSCQCESYLAVPGESRGYCPPLPDH